MLGSSSKCSGKVYAEHLSLQLMGPMYQGGHLDPLMMDPVTGDSSLYNLTRGVHTGFRSVRDTSNIPN